MPKKITNYQCPSCMGPLHFDSGAGSLKCDYCGSVFTVAEVEAMYAQQNESAAAASEAEEAAQAADHHAEDPWDVGDAGGEWGDEAAGLRVYNCPSCGAELICEETTAATSCPYCGNPTIVPGQLSGAKKPDYIIPFKLDRNEALAALKRHYGKKPFLPKAFSQHNHLEEIRGIYVPFWLYDATADADITFHATRTHTHTHGDYEETITEHYNVRRAGTARFLRIPVDGSSKMPDDHMDSIEPFDYSEMVPFAMSYLPGYLADKYDVDAQQSASRADDRCRVTAQAAMENDVRGYASVTPRSISIRLKKGQVSYALFPVWILNTKWQGRDYLFAMNGQTGKMVGDLPVSKARYWGTFAGIAAACFALLHLSGISSFFASLFSFLPG